MDVAYTRQHGIDHVPSFHERIYCMQKVNDNIYVLIVLGIAGMFLLAGGIIFFMRSYIKRVALQKLELQKKEMEYQAKLFSAVIESQQEEQRKIGKEIHDEAGSLLSSVRFQLSSAAMSESGNMVYKDSIATIDKLSNKIRNISHLLSPPELELSGFHEALDSLCDDFTTDKMEIHLRDEVPGFIPKNKFQLSVSLYRIMQELITNTIKHANATGITIHIKNEGNFFVIDFADNGIGINITNGSVEGLGMQSIRSRLLMIHATHRMESINGKGFRFILYLGHQFILS